MDFWSINADNFKEVTGFSTDQVHFVLLEVHKRHLFRQNLFGHLTSALFNDSNHFGNEDVDKAEFEMNRCLEADFIYDLSESLKKHGLNLDEDSTTEYVHSLMESMAEKLINKITATNSTNSN